MALNGKHIFSYGLLSISIWVCQSKDVVWNTNNNIDDGSINWRQDGTCTVNGGSSKEFIVVFWFSTDTFNFEVSGVNASIQSTCGNDGSGSFKTVTVMDATPNSNTTISYNVSFSKNDVSGVKATPTGECTIWYNDTSDTADRNVDNDLISNMSVTCDGSTSNNTTTETQSTTFSTSTADNFTCPSYCSVICASNLTTDELQQRILALKRKLTLDVLTLSSTIRSKTCASDDRKSSTSIGLGSVTILVILGLFCILSDTIRIIQHFFE